MSDIVLKDITSGYNYSRITYNFEVIEHSINNDILHLAGGNNTMRQALDMNSYPLLNVKTDVDDPASLLTVADADTRYYNVKGDTLEGTMNVASNYIVGLPVAIAPTHPVRKQEFDSEVSARIAADTSLRKDFTKADKDIIDGYTSADANLQSQITGEIPLEASAFSEISWHGQEINNSVTIPDNKNAWSFGPVMTIAQGQMVTVGSGSFWTIANGEVQQ